MSGSSCCRTKAHERQGRRLGIDMTHDRSHSALAELQTLLDTFGADRDRWPQAARTRLEGALETNGEAARLLAEAAALDRVLAHAPLPAPERRAALADRILAEARNASAAAAGAGRRQSGIVIPWPGRARPATPRSPAAEGGVAAAPWRAAALLAASLALGVFIGALDLAPGAVDPLMNVVVYNSDLDQTAALSNEGLAAAFDEDFL